MEELDRPNPIGRRTLKDMGFDPDRFQGYLNQLPGEERRVLVVLLEAGIAWLMDEELDAPAPLKHALLNSRLTPAEHEQWLSERPEKAPPAITRRRPRRPRG